MGGILVSDGLDPSGGGYYIEDYVFSPIYGPSMIASVVINMLIQGLIVAYYIRSHPEFIQSLKGSSTLRSECGIILISILMNAFFISRIVHTWVSLESCSVAHYFFMFILELQLISYSLLQFQRFAHTVISERMRKWARTVIILAGIALAALLMIYQQSYIEDNTCHFINEVSVAVAVACFHFLLDVSVIYVFWRHLQLLHAAESSTKLRRIVMIGVGCLTLFGVWLGFLAFANRFSDPGIVEIAYNFHFSIILIVMLIPKHIQNVYSRIILIAAAASQKGKTLNRRLSSIVSTHRISQSSGHSLQSGLDSSSSVYVGGEIRSDVSSIGPLTEASNMGSQADDTDLALRVKMDLEGIDWRAKLKPSAQ